MRTQKTTEKKDPTMGKKGKTAIKETLLTPRFYTTDFEQMEQLFNTEINKNLNMKEFEACLKEFRTDYNQTHFVRDKAFKEAADKMEDPFRSIFVEFLERSCTAEFSGFLLYKEIARRLKTNRTTARIFPAVLDVENPEFKRKLDRMADINTKLSAVSNSNDPDFMKKLKKIPLAAALLVELVAAYLMRPVDAGSVDIADFEPKLFY